MKNIHPINRWVWPVLVCFLNFPAHSQQDPSQVFGELFEKVQMAKVFEDSKTFADCTPKFQASMIMERYEKQKNRRGFDLKKFVAQHFDLPPTPASGFVSDRSLSIDAHIQKLWPVLTREPDTRGGSLLPLPKRYIVPGGRFREIYYWDSYFTMLGLQADGRIDLIADMVDNFSYLIQTYGFIPNGNRAYYLSRSQPPFFSLMVALLAQEKGEEIWGEYLSSLEKEYAFWMDGKERINPGQPAYRRVVVMPDGSVLNRFWDDRPMPRPESFEEDVVLAEKTGRTPEELYRHIRAACESGWDFSSRWFRNPNDQGSIHTADIIPVDLNSLLYFLEQSLAHAHQLQGNQEKALAMQLLAKARKEALRKYTWNEALGFHFDYDFMARELKNSWSMAGAYPMFFELLTPDEARRVARGLEDKLLEKGGFLSTTQNNGQQWDAPNGWAPLQWMAIEGLRKYGLNDLATKAATRWISLNREVYTQSGKLVEKYDVTGSDKEAGGGEYPLQDGFGWTNGVLLKLIREFDK
jgi:alpha,alpha-trehalase